jgi:uncharacterized protein YdeI (YjbR/CyaY-like superfamily)
MVPHYFENKELFRDWLEKNHLTESELYVGYFKKGSGKLSINWPESVKEALCFGWIDGVRRSVDHERYCIRFTPRRPNSIWSNVNTQFVEELINQGLMKNEGLIAYSKRKSARSGIYSYETQEKNFSHEFESLFRENKKAWMCFSNCSKSYQKTTIHWAMDAKQHPTRIKRLKELIQACESNEFIKLASYDIK